MTKHEIGKLFAVIHAYYPTFRPEDIDITIKAWALAFGEITYKQAEQGVLSFVRQDTKGFPPCVGQVIAHILSQEQERVSMTEAEAWSLVRKSIRNSGYHSTEEFAKLPKLIQKAVGSAENLRDWGLVESDEVSTVIYSNFLRALRNVKLREEQNALTALTSKNTQEKIEKGGQTK